MTCTGARGASRHHGPAPPATKCTLRRTPQRVLRLVRMMLVTHTHGTSDMPTGARWGNCSILAPSTHIPTATSSSSTRPSGGLFSRDTGQYASTMCLMDVADGENTTHGPTGEYALVTPADEQAPGPCQTGGAHHKLRGAATGARWGPWPPQPPRAVLRRRHGQGTRPMHMCASWSMRVVAGDAADVVG